MQSVSRALNVIHEYGSWFTRASEVRLLLVQVAGDLRKPALKLLPMLEFSADNFSPWVVLEDAHTRTDAGWTFRANQFANEWERRQEAYSKAGQILLPAVPAPLIDPACSSWDPALAAFHHLLVAAVAALRDPLRGLVVILAPSVVDSLEHLENDLQNLISSDSLSVCRFVLVLDITSGLPQRLLDALSDHALACVCSVDPTLQEQDIQAMIANDSGPSRPGAFPLGAVPPARVDDPPRMPPEQFQAELTKSGINPDFLEHSPRLSSLLLGAALAMSRGRGTEALTKQAQARDLCARLQIHETAVICQIALACYRSGLGDAEGAIAELQNAVLYSREHSLHKAEAQSHLAIGLQYLVRGRTLEAVEEYRQSAQSAELADWPPLAIEAWRMAGQVSAQAGFLDESATLFQQAMRVATGGDPSLVSSSSAPEAARQFAQLCDSRGLSAQAQSLYQLADEMEQPSPVLVASGTFVENTIPEASSC